MKVYVRLLYVCLTLGLSGCPEQARLAAGGESEPTDRRVASASPLDERTERTLIDVVTLAASEDGCTSGGVHVRAGRDANGDGDLDAAEIERDSRVCNGETGSMGADGSDGVDGADGSDGRDGVDGSDGRDGVDGSDGRDGVDGSDGASGLSSLVRVVAAAPSAACPSGGSTIETGIDIDADGTLADEEVDSSALICNGVDGADGQDAGDDESCVVDTASGAIRLWCDSGLREVEVGPLTPVRASASSIGGGSVPAMAQWPDRDGWASEHAWGNAEEWLRYDFGAPALLTRVRAYSRNNEHGLNPTIQGSVDGVTWTDILVLGDDTFEPGPWDHFSSVDQPLSTEVAYRYVRLHSDATPFLYYAWLAFDGALLD